MKKIRFAVVIFTVLSFVSFNNVIAGKTEKGKIIVEIGDNFLEKKSETKYFLQRKDTSLVPLTREQIHMMDYPPPRPGQRAILSPKGKLHLSPYSKTKKQASKSSGGIDILIVLIQPSGENIPWEAEKAKEYFQPSKDFFEDKRQHSKATLNLTVVGWKKSDKTKAELTTADGNSVSTITIPEAVKLVDDSVDFTEIDCLFIVVADNDGTFTRAWASTGVGYTQTDDGICDFSYVRMGSDLFSRSPRVNSHELGHALGDLKHEAGENIAKKDACGYTGSEPEEYNSFASVMGDRYSFFSLYAQYTQLGWLDKERVVVFSSYFSSAKLCPREVESTDKKQLAIIEVSENKYISIELYEKSLEPYLNDDNVKSGLVIREHGEVVNNDGNGGYNANVFLKEYNDYESFLSPDEEICGLGSKGNISIKYVSLTTGVGEETIAEVEVTIGGALEPTPTPTPTPTPSPTSSPSPTPSPTPSPSPSATPTPSPTPSPSPSPTPTSSPTPTPVLGEIFLDVSLNKETVRRGGKVKVKVSVKDADGNLTEADKISCQMTRVNGTWLYGVKRNTAEARFNFRIRSNNPVGPYKISVSASKKGHEDAKVEKFFKVKK